MVLNGHVSPEDLKPSVLSDSETGGSAVESTPPARHGKKADKRRGKGSQTEGSVIVDAFSISGPSPACDGPSAEVIAGIGVTTEEAASPIIPRGKRKKTTSGASVSEDGDHAETPAAKKKKRKAIMEPETPNAEDRVSSELEWFVENYRPASTDGWSGKKIRKKAKKAWNVMSEEQRQSSTEPPSRGDGVSPDRGS